MVLCVSIVELPGIHVFLPSLAQVGLLGAYTAGTYVDSMWGVAQFSLSNESPCMCAFVGDKKSVVGERCPLENECTCAFISCSLPPPPLSSH